MDTKTAYTRTFLMLKEEPLHEESIKTSYYTWWQNVRESYQARSLRLTKIGYEYIKNLNIKIKRAGLILALFLFVVLLFYIFNSDFFVVLKWLHYPWIVR